MELLLVANKRGRHLFSPSNNSDCFLSARQTTTRNITIRIMSTAQLYGGEFLSFLPFCSVFHSSLIPTHSPSSPFVFPLIFGLLSIAHLSHTLSPHFFLHYLRFTLAVSLYPPHPSPQLLPHPTPHLSLSLG